MWVVGAVMLEFAAVLGVIWAFCFLDEALSRWERNTIKKLRRKAKLALKAVFDWLDIIEIRINWRTRKIRREICASLLVRDGVTVEPVQTERRDLSADFEEVMRLLSE